MRLYIAIVLLCYQLHPSFPILGLVSSLWIVQEIPYSSVLQDHLYNQIIMQDASAYEASQEITYLDNVIQESLRLYPPATRYSYIQTASFNYFSTCMLILINSLFLMIELIECVQRLLMSKEVLSHRVLLLLFLLYRSTTIHVSGRILKSLIPTGIRLVPIL